MKAYLSNRMTGVPQFNFPWFDQAAADLRAQGIDIVSPAELDDPETREMSLASPDGSPGSGSANGQKWIDFILRDLKLIGEEEVDAVIVGPEWFLSRGARLETYVAYLTGLPVLDMDLNPVPFDDLVGAWAGAIVTLDASITGGEPQTFIDVRMLLSRVA